MGKIIAVGDGSPVTDTAIEWLKAHGAKVEEHMCIALIELPDSAKLERGSNYWSSTIQFNDQPDTDNSYVELEHYDNVSDSGLELFIEIEEEE